MAKVCRACEGPLCPICGGCIQEGECGCLSTWEENPITGLSEEEIERREARHVRELRKIRDELVATCEQVAVWITVDPNFQGWPAAKSYLTQLEQVIAKARGEAPNA